MTIAFILEFQKSILLVTHINGVKVKNFRKDEQIKGVVMQQPIMKDHLIKKQEQ